MNEIDDLKKRLKNLKYFESNLSEDNIGDFESLKDEISETLSENYRIKFNKLRFYKIRADGPISHDDLPF
jgi:hypothetical protein